MKSKSIKLPKHSAEVIKNKTYDFANFYKPESENTLITGKKKSDESSSKENDSTLVMKSRIFKAKRLSIKKEKNDKLDDTNNISQPNINQENLPHRSKKSKKSKTTSTSNVKEFKMDKDVNENVKSIMKLSVVADKSLDLSIIDQSSSKPKKRNKSVSFILEENEEVVVKKSKSEQSSSNEKNIKSKKNKLRKHKEKEQENTNNTKVVNIDTDKSDNNTLQSSNENSENNILSQENCALTNKTIKIDKKKNKKQKFEKDRNIVNINSQQDDKIHTEKDKKNKTLKKKNKTNEAVEKEIKPDVIAEDLQNLNIGDNAHTLTNLLDEMAVVDKNKNKKDKKKFNKNKSKNITATNEKAATENDDKENNEEKEKVKWMKRKWNKDKKGTVSEDKQSTCIIIENLPLRIMCNYKKLLMDHFAKFGIIKQVGVAELYSIENPEVFTTTINFYSEDAAEKSLEEDNTLFEDRIIHLKRPMPPSQTTLVVRSYSELSETSLSSVFFGAGRIRNVRRVIKGKKSMSTAFIEFDGPKAVKQAMKMAEDVKIDGKKIFVSKFEVRNKNKKQKSENKKATESEDSEE